MISLKKTYLDQKLKNIVKNLTLNKTRHLKVKKKQNDLPEKVELISTKRLTKGLID